MKDKYGNNVLCDFYFAGCNTLVLSGGALKGVYFLGALFRLKNLKFKYFAATSAGSVISLLLSIGYSPVDIFKELLKDETVNIMKVLDVTIEKVANMMERKGFKQDITFKELFEYTGVELAFVATNVSKFREEIFSVHTHADTCVLTAIKLSCSLPIIFPVNRYKRDVFIDGIFFDNFPIKLCKLFKNRYKTLAMTTSTSYYDKRISMYYQRPEIYKIIIIPDKVNKYFQANKEDKFFMFMSGYNFVDENIKLSKRKKRRNSI